MLVNAHTLGGWIRGYIFDIMVYVSGVLGMGMLIVNTNFNLKRQGNGLTKDR
jgi:hypothetical protein